MKTDSQLKEVRLPRARAYFRVGAAGLLVAAAAALATLATSPPTLPWAVPTIAVGNNPVGIAVDTAKHTIYVANGGDDTLSVIDSSTCNSISASNCAPIGTLTVGPNPLYLIFDSATDTIYTTLPGGDGNQVAVVNGATCNATNTSGCGQKPATVTVPGAIVIGLAFDSATHSLYVGDANEGPIFVINTATCNATNTSGCGQTPVQTSAGGDTIAIDHVNHGVYVSDFNDNLIRVFNGATCNASNTSGCGQAPVTIAANFDPTQAAVDEATHTVYVGVGSGEDTLGSVLMIDGSKCNGKINSGCGKTPSRAIVGSLPDDVIIDPATETVYVESEESSKISIINGATCNATKTTGCAKIFPALAVGFNPGGFMDVDPKTHTLYTTSQDTNAVWVLNEATCNASNTSGCTKFAPVTTTGAAPAAIAANPNTHTVYANNSEDNTVSVINTALCNASHPAGCNRTWRTIAVGDFPYSIAVNRTTNTIYVGDRGENMVSVINGATCNASVTSGCGQTAPKTAVGRRPFQIAVDETNSTIYVANRNDGTVSVINGTVCNGMNSSGCGQTWPTVVVGTSPQALGVNPLNHTVYVANTGDDTVSVIDGSTCNGTNTSGCGQTPATISVGAAPRSVGVDPSTNTVFVGNRDDGTVSIIDGLTCNATDTSGCGQTPAAIFVMAFPDFAGNGEYQNGRAIVIEPATHKAYLPEIGDSDAVIISGSPCTGSDPSGCTATIVPLRMGGFSVFATLDESSGTVYVANDTDGTVSVFPSSN